jgi:short subunit dehydrogenase-like uncharacterized protein
MGTIFIYGAYGYTGKIIVDVAVNKGLKPLIGGRNKELTKALADEYQLDFEVLAVKDYDHWTQVLAKVDLLINCAGPFALTVEHIVPLCLKNRVHYLDITGEIEVFSYIASLDKEAQQSGVVLMPGVGFDVVPTDCLSAKLKERLPDGEQLVLAFQGSSGISRGTALSMARRYHNGGMIRQNGKLINVPIAHEVKEIAFGGMNRLCMTIPWGDVYTAYFTTGIPNIKVFTGVNQKTLNSLLTFKKFKWAAKTGLIQWLMRKIIRSKVTGPSLENRKTKLTYLWGQISDKSGKSVTLEMQTMESYQLTAFTAIRAAQVILEGGAQPGYRTPAGAFGSDFIDQFEKFELREVND